MEMAVINCFNQNSYLFETQNFGLSAPSKDPAAARPRPGGEVAPQRDGSSGQSLATAEESVKKSCLRSQGWTKKVKTRFSKQTEVQTFDFSEYVR